MSVLTLIPEVVLVAFALLLPAFRLLNVKNQKLPAYFSLAGLGISFLSILCLMGILPFKEFFDITVPTTLFGGMLGIDNFSLLFQLLFVIVASLVVLASSTYMQSDKNKCIYYSLLLLATVGMMIVAMAKNTERFAIG